MKAAQTTGAHKGVQCALLDRPNVRRRHFRYSQKLSKTEFALCHSSQRPARPLEPEIIWQVYTKTDFVPCFSSQRQARPQPTAPHCSSSRSHVKPQRWWNVPSIDASERATSSSRQQPPLLPRCRPPRPLPLSQSPPLRCPLGPPGP